MEANKREFQRKMSPRTWENFYLDGFGLIDPHYNSSLMKIKTTGPSLFSRSSNGKKKTTLLENSYAKNGKATKRLASCLE